MTLFSWLLLVVGVPTFGVCLHRLLRASEQADETARVLPSNVVVLPVKRMERTVTLGYVVKREGA